MPELPEVETIRRALDPALSGRRFTALRAQQQDILRKPATLAAFRRALVGRRVEAVERRAKYLSFVLDGGWRLQVQLRMTGRFAIVPRGGAPPDAFTHVAAELDLEGDETLVYDDVRRLGGLWMLSAAEWAALDARLGPEPLEPAFTTGVFSQALRGSRTPIKSALLDQRRLAGVGNIYASEALHAAGIDPRRAASSLTGGEADRLRRELVRILAGALAHAGTTLRDYRSVNGRSGSYQTRLRAYGREGEPCDGCGEPISRLVQSGRSTFLCTRCQS